MNLNIQEYDLREQEIYNRVKKGELRNDIYKDYEYKDVRSMDGFMRRRGYFIVNNCYEKKANPYLNLFQEAASPSKKAELIIKELEHAEDSDTISSITEKYGFQTVQEMRTYLKENGFIYHSDSRSYQQQHTSYSTLNQVENATPISKKNVPFNPIPTISNANSYRDLLAFLMEHKDTLADLLQKNEAGQLFGRISIPGKKIPKTTYISKSLCTIVKEHSLRHGIPIREIFEQATIEYLLKNGYQNEISMLLSNK